MTLQDATMGRRAAMGRGEEVFGNVVALVDAGEPGMGAA